MDIEVALITARRVTATAIETQGEFPGNNCSQLAEAFQAIDEWISGGGRLPRAWQGQALDKLTTTLRTGTQSQRKDAAISILAENARSTLKGAPFHGLFDLPEVLDYLEENGGY